MIVDAWTTTRTKDKLTFQIDHAWLDEWPMINALGQPVKLPPGCSVQITPDGIEFTRERDNEMLALQRRNTSPRRWVGLPRMRSARGPF